MLSSLWQPSSNALTPMIVSRDALAVTEIGAPRSPTVRLAVSPAKIAMSMSTPRRPSPEWEEEAQPMQQAAATRPRKPPAPSPLVRRLERSLATLASYNARPPPVLSVSPRSSPRRPQSARPDSRRPVLSPRALRPASAPAHREAPSPSSSVLPSQYFSLLMGSDGSMVCAVF